MPRTPADWHGLCFVNARVHLCLWVIYFRTSLKIRPQKFGGTRKKHYLCTRLHKARAFSSVGLEHLPYKQRVGGSNPSTPTGVFPCSPSGLQGYFFRTRADYGCKNIENHAPHTLFPFFSFFCAAKHGKSHNFSKFASLKKYVFFLII